VTKREFEGDLLKNYQAMEKFKIRKKDARYFIPPYEWFNDSISSWSKDMGVQLINYTPGTKSTADYTNPDLTNYRGSEEIMLSITEMQDRLNGFILLIHIGTDPARTDKFYKRLPELIEFLQASNFEFVRIDQLLE
jgi:peptidoglycan/xylan/chitin deacetylase (PgdA/CDA1 family)